MNITEAKEQVKDAVEAYLTRDETGAYEIPPVAQRPLFLLGAPGIGKTAIIEQVAREQGIGLVSYAMTHHTRQSALGLPFIVEREYESGEKFSVSEYTMSEIIASIWDYMERTGLSQGILFLDEINCVSETLYPSMLQFLQFKTFGRHRVPDGWIVVCAGNPPEYNKSVFDFDVVTLDRLRKVDIEPDLGAWLAYAYETRVHPAIISYLDVKHGQFYSVESTPQGKSFVTARGWDDLSRVMKLYEKKGKRIDRTLIAQYLQDENIAERFAQYYALFSKYRSDYQVQSILDGTEGPEITQRAQEARFDERLALIRLMLDALDARLESVIEEERVTATVRDVLRNAKERLINGETIDDTVSVAIDQLTAEADRQVASDVANAAQMRPLRLAVERLRGYLTACEQARTREGEDAFRTLSNSYGTDTARFREAVTSGSSAIDNAFAFVEHAFGDDREMAALVAEMTARRATSQFISLFGSDSYFAHNRTVVAQGNREALMARIGELDLAAAEEAAIREEAARLAEQLKGCSACSGGC